jgi:Protein of unknown function (DUF3631)/Domain of unknown function (DUF3854)
VTGYPLSIFPPHAALLEASAISPEVARARGYVSVDTRTRLESAGFAKSQRTVPGLLIPLHGTDGTVRLHQYRPDNPRIGTDGKPRKYETPFRATLCLDVPPGALAALTDPDVPLWATEGARKADAAVSAGLCCIALLGVDGWQSKGVALPDWKDVRLKDRDVLVCFDSDVMTKPSVAGALARFTAWLDYRGAKVRHVILPEGPDGSKTGLDDYVGTGHTAAGLRELARDPAVVPPKAKAAATAAQPVLPKLPKQDGAALLGDVHKFTGRYVAFPSAAAAVAVTLWAAHCHAVACFDSTPRMALLSPEPGSGKTRALEVLDLLCPAPMHALNATVAAIFRSIEAERPVLLIDECDAIFTRRGKDDSNEELRALLNAGHRKGATIPRCTGLQHEVHQFPVYAAVALAGLGDLPATLMSRAVVIRMRRRAPGEQIEPFRHRLAAPRGHALRDRLAAWAAQVKGKLGASYPEMPPGVTDRPADVWEPLIAVADAAGGDWPERARAACTELAAAAETGEASLGVRLLADLAEVFGAADQLPTAVILDRLHKLDEAPWAALGKLGKPLDARGLATRLRGYDVRSAVIRVGELTPRGYRAADLHDPWTRYVPDFRASATSATPQQPQADTLLPVADDGHVADASATPAQTATDSDALTSDVADVADVADLREPEPTQCRECGWPSGSNGCTHTTEAT